MGAAGIEIEQRQFCGEGDSMKSAVMLMIGLSVAWSICGAQGSDPGTNPDTAQNANDQQSTTYYPSQQVQAGRATRCSARGNAVCAGCSVSCSPGQQASCREGEVHDTTCWTASKCECLGSGPPPASVFTQGADGRESTNSCSTPDRRACRGCSASCKSDEKAICTPSIPGEPSGRPGVCDVQAWCRCERK